MQVATVAAIVGAGTRDEPGQCLGSRSKLIYLGLMLTIFSLAVRAPGVARMLKQMAFKKSTNRSALRFDRSVLLLYLFLPISIW